MSTSLFLARVIGPFMVIIALVIISRRQNFMKVADQMLNNQWMITMTGLPALILGLLIVNSHNLWVSDWRVIITLVGWLAIVKGIIRLFFPETVARMIQKMLKDGALNLVSIVALFLGLYLSYMGFMA